MEFSWMSLEMMSWLAFVRTTTCPGGKVCSEMGTVQDFIESTKLDRKLVGCNEHARTSHKHKWQTEKHVSWPFKQVSWLYKRSPLYLTWCWKVSYNSPFGIEQGSLPASNMQPLVLVLHQSVQENSWSFPHRYSQKMLGMEGAILPLKEVVILPEYNPSGLVATPRRWKFAYPNNILDSDFKKEECFTTAKVDSLATNYQLYLFQSLRVWSWPLLMLW